MVVHKDGNRSRTIYLSLSPSSSPQEAKQIWVQIYKRKKMKPNPIRIKFYQVRGNSWVSICILKKCVHILGIIIIKIYVT